MKLNKKKPFLLFGLIFACLFLLGLRLHRLKLNFSPPESVLLIGTDSRDANKYLLVNIQPDQESSQVLMFNPPKLIAQNLSTESSPPQATQILGVLVSRVEFLGQPLPDRTLALGRLMLVSGFNQLRSGSQNLGQSWEILKLLARGKNIQTLDLGSGEVIPATLKLQNEYQPLATLGQSCPITVSNATGRSGLASDVGNLLDSQGGLVVRMINYPETLTNTEVLVDVSATECFAVAEIIAASLTEAATVSKQPNLYSNSRATIEIRLGENYSKSTSS